MGWFAYEENDKVLSSSGYRERGCVMKIQWEYDLVEKPFCEQLKAMGWEWLEGDTDVPDFTERQSFREVPAEGTVGSSLASAQPA